MAGLVPAIHAAKRHAGSRKWVETLEPVFNWAAVRRRGWPGRARP
jgi:hypothetical protein